MLVSYNTGTPFFLTGGRVFSVGFLESKPVVPKDGRPHCSEALGNLGEWSPPMFSRFVEREPQDRVKGSMRTSGKFAVGCSRPP